MPVYEFAFDDAFTDIRQNKVDFHCCAPVSIDG
jgi:hypothetical protein